jgi:hypothetical protein
MISTLVVVAIAFVAGVGIGAIGPGGVFVTVGLYVLTSHSPGTIAGTTSAALFAGGIVGVAAYRQSGELTSPAGRRVAVALTLASAVGAFAGSQLNAALSSAAYGTVLGAFVVLAGVLVVLREVRPGTEEALVAPETRAGTVAVAALGVGVGTVSGLMGVGGPVLAVPALVVLGVPMLVAVGAAQLQSVAITGSATLGYLLRGTVSPVLLATIVPSLLLGVGVGWRVAHAVDVSRLRWLLGAVLVAFGLYLLV